MEFIVVACVLVALYGLHRLALWLESKDWLYYRRKPTAGSIGRSLFLDIHQMMEPGKKHVVEVTRKQVSKPFRFGDPPVPGQEKDS